ncbi:hypothetical protein I5I47_29715, partial [Pseudomonas aeruginosa]|nr:hypothetical protein [Pseudomonas aeruginosa]
MDGSPGFARGRAESLRVDVGGATGSYPTPSGKDGPRGMIEDGLWDAFNDYHMGITAEN